MPARVPLALAKPSPTTRRTADTLLKLIDGRLPPQSVRGRGADTGNGQHGMPSQISRAPTRRASGTPATHSNITARPGNPYFSASAMPENPYFSAPAMPENPYFSAPAMPGDPYFSASAPSRTAPRGCNRRGQGKSRCSSGRRSPVAHSITAYRVAEAPMTLLTCRARWAAAAPPHAG